VHADGAEGVGGLSLLVEMLEPVDEAAEDFPELAGDAGPGLGVHLADVCLLERAEQVLRQPRAEQARHHVADAGEPQRGSTSGQAPAGDQVDAEADHPADEADDRAGCGGDSVGHDQLVVPDDVRGARRDRAEEKPVHAEDRQGADVERHAGLAAEHHDPGDGDHRGPDQRAVDDDLPSRPTVDEHPGERPDQRVGDVQDGERGDRGARLGDQAGGEELAEVTLGKDILQVGPEGGPPAFRYSIVACGHVFSLIRLSAAP
jgi:hypothetical protein